MSTPNIINIKFDAARGECDTRSREALTGDPYGTLPTAKRPGYTFDGWFTQPGVNGEKIVTSDTVTSEDDITLYAHYTKIKGGNKKRSTYRQQKIVLITLISIIALLVVGYFVVDYIIGILPYTDPADPDAKYYAKPQDGVYAMFDEDGKVLPKNDDGYYLTAAGTQLSVDPATGEVKVYAVVDVEGVEAVGANSRILMFAQIRQSDVAKIKVENQHGSFTFYVDDDGKVQIKGFETDKVLVQYDKEKYAYLCSGAGNPLTTRKLDTAEVLKRGYAEYGLVPETRVDEEGNEYEYTPTRYTVTSKSGVSHTVLIGDKLISEGGYYVKMEGDDNPAVYIMSNTTYESALLLPLEQLITPIITYPTTLMNCYNVENFIIASRSPDGSDEPVIELAFDFIDLLERENSLYSTEPYLAEEGGGYKYAGYRLNGNAISTLLQAIYEPNINRVCKLGATREDLEEYGLVSFEHTITYGLRVDTDEDGKVDATIPNALLVTKNPENGNYFVYSEMCDLIVEVDKSTLYFLDYDPIDWVDANIIWINLAFLKSVDITSPTYNARLEMDNSKSDQTKAISSADITFTINGETPDYIVYKESYASGKITEETPVYNLRQFYKTLLSLTIAGSAYDGHYALTDEQMAAYRAMDDSECQLVLHLEGEDMATTYNKEFHDKNNTASLTLRFYRYSEGRSYMTINGEGEFYVSAAFVEKIIADAERLEAGTLIDATAKT